MFVTACYLLRGAGRLNISAGALAAFTITTIAVIEPSNTEQGLCAQIVQIGYNIALEASTNEHPDSGPFFDKGL